MAEAAAATATKTVQEQLTNPNSLLPATGGTATLTGFAGLIVTLIILWLRRRLSRDAAQITQDRAEGITIKTLMEVNKSLVEENERVKKEAREAWGYRTKDAQRIAHLEATNDFLKKELDRLQPAVQTAVNALHELSDSGFTPLVDKPTKPKR